MPIKSLSQSSLTNFQKYSSMLAGNAAFSPSSFDLLETQILTSDTTSVTFSGLGSYSSYKQLQLRATLRTSYTALSNGLLRFYANADTGTNYSVKFMYANGTNVSSSYQTSTDIPLLALTLTSGDGTGQFSTAVIDIFDFSDTNKFTSLRVFEGRHGDSNSTQGGIAMREAIWMDTSQVTSLQFYDGRGYDWVTGCRFSLYGAR